MQSLTHAGCYYRTKLMSLEKAGRFARCLGTNRRFTEVSIEASERAKSEAKYFVRYLPKSETRQLQMLEGQQQAREARAEAQGVNYLFVLDEGGRFFWCHNLASGEVYETTEETCDCPDFHYRCRGSGLHCKHVVMLREGHSPIQGWDTEQTAVPALTTIAA